MYVILLPFLFKKSKGAILKARLPSISFMQTDHRRVGTLSSTVVDTIS